MKCKITLLINNAESIDIRLYTTNNNTKIPKVLKNFLLNKSFKPMKNEIKGFLFLKNIARR